MENLLSKETKTNVDNYLAYKTKQVEFNNLIIEINNKYYKKKSPLQKDIFLKVGIETKRHLAMHYSLFTSEEIENFLLSEKDEEINSNVAKFQRELTIEQIEKYNLNKSLVYFYKSHRRDGSYSIKEKDYLNKIKPFLDWNYLYENEKQCFSVNFVKEKINKYTRKSKDDLEKILKDLETKKKEIKEKKPQLEEQEELNDESKKNLKEEIEKINTDFKPILQDLLSKCISSTFTLSGSVITQTGTDTSLAGLSGIAGVTVLNSNQKKIYDLNSVRLVMNGTLTINGNNEQLNFRGLSGSVNEIIISNGGRLNIRAFAGSTEKFYYPLTVIYSDRIPVNAFSSNNAVLLVQSGGTYDAIGGTFQSNCLFAFQIGSTAIFEEHTLVGLSASQLQLFGTSVFNGTLYVKGSIRITFNTSGTISKLAPSGASGRAIEGSNIVIDFPDYQGTVNFSEINLRDDVRARFIGSIKGSGHNVTPADAGTTPLNGGIAGFYRPVQGILKNIASTGINGIVYMRDTNNGSRQDMTSSYGSTYNFTNDQVLIWDVASGTSTAKNVLLKVTTLVKDGNGTTDFFNDIRNKGNNTSDEFDFYAWSYGFLPQSTTRVLTGLGTLPVDFALLADNNVTLSENDAVAKLASSFSVNTGTNTITVTSNSTLDDLYNAMKAYKTRNVQAQLEYPTIAEQPVTASGDTLVTAMSVVGIEFLTTGTKFKKLQTTCTANGAFSIEVIGTVNQATPTNLPATAKATTLAYNTNTDISVTYSTETQIGTVRNDGTGIVTIAGGSITDYTDAQINYLDSNITFSGVDNITFYPTSTDANAGTNAGETITTSPYVFKFGSVISGVTMTGTVNIRYVIGGKITIGTLTIALGTNTFSLTDNELLGAITAKVDLTAKETTLLQTETDIIAEINANETKIDTAITKIDTKPTLAQIEESTVIAKEITAQAIKGNTDLIPATI